jgi:hypothetical protein
MSAILTLNLDPDVLVLAEREAEARHTTVPELVAQQLRILAKNGQASRSGKTPITDSLRGVVQITPEFDEDATITDELRRRNGIKR